MGESSVNSSDDIIWGLDLTQEDWFLETWACGKLTSVEDSSSGWDDLTSTSMDGISMKGNIKDINSDTSHVLVTHYTFFCGPLEGSFHGVLDFRKELDTLSGINKTVRSVSVWAEAPNLLGI